MTRTSILYGEYVTLNLIQGLSGSLSYGYPTKVGITNTWLLDTCALVGQEDHPRRHGKATLVVASYDGLLSRWLYELFRV